MSSNADARIIYTGPSARGWHRLQQAAECLQKYAWHYERPKAERPANTTSSPALIRGSLVHLALAQHYARMRSRQTDPLVQLADPAIGPEDSWAEPEEAVELIAKLEGAERYAEGVIATYHEYVRHYDNDEDELFIVDIEEASQTTVRDQYLFTGRLDLAYRDAAGRIWVVDHKTTSRLLSSARDYYGVSGQLIGYRYLAAKKYGEAFAGLVVNMVQHGPGAKFSRFTLPRSPKFEASFEQTVMDIEASIENAQKMNRHYADWPKAMNELTCYSRYGPCPYMDECRFGEGAKKGGNWSFSV